MHKIMRRALCRLGGVFEMICWTLNFLMKAISFERTEVVVENSNKL